MNKTVVIGITSSIAAFKIFELVRDLKADGINVFIIMTKHASQMVDPAEFEKISGNKVSFELFEKCFDYKNILKNRKVDHIEIAQKADVFIVAPATANTIAKIAYGIADDFLTTALLATKAPVIICPTMNTNMWNNPVVEENIVKLKNKGYQIIEPMEGMLACGIEGKGKLADISIIKEEINLLLARSNSLKGKKIIITSGGTSEKIDEIRYITNRSSGKMGAAIAEECYLRGAEVLLLRARNSTKPRYQIPKELFVTTEDLYTLVKKNIGDADIIFHVAAVSDFRTEKPRPGKISSDKSVTLKLIPQIKISDQIKKINPDIKLIIFKAEYGLGKKELIKAAEIKLEESQADAIIANDVSRKDRGFESDFNEVLIVHKVDKVCKVHKVPFSSKREVAKEIIGYLSDSSVL
ncbi:bifunctional phosphopantothenoylcysteine decarboxylase/phosphopantothenate--cysteine ligase CoaBC [Patescibacteria group bacterium]|nr:bifunctional phosphopantothenoylcysteine decarboxylase/phosphopantothenate--cysteine ligase CoaBC [Patescibacteria group bacterium]